MDALPLALGMPSERPDRMPPEDPYDLERREVVWARTFVPNLSRRGRKVIRQAAIR